MWFIHGWRMPGRPVLGGTRRIRLRRDRELRSASGRSRRWLLPNDSFRRRLYHACRTKRVREQRLDVRVGLRLLAVRHVHPTLRSDERRMLLVPRAGTPELRHDLCHLRPIVQRRDTDLRAAEVGAEAQLRRAQTVKIEVAATKDELHLLGPRSAPREAPWALLSGVVGAEVSRVDLP